MNNTTRTLPISVIVLYLLLWARYPLFEFIIGVCYHIPLLSEFSPQIPDFLIILFAVLSLPYLVKRIRLIDLCLYIGIVLFYFISKYNHPDNSEALEYYTIPFLLIGLPYYFVGVVPAKIVGYRYKEEDIVFLIKSAWWNKDLDWIRKNWRALNNFEEYKLIVSNEQ